MPVSNTRRARSRPSSRSRVEIANHQRRRIDKKVVASVVRRVLAGEGWSGDVDVAIVGAELMRALNAKFLGHDFVTDALSFTFTRDSKKKTVEGEVVVCTDQAIETARGYNRRWQDELLLYVVHGTLHLIGFHDDSGSRRRQMRAAESKYLHALGIDVEPVDKGSTPRKVR